MAFDKLGIYNLALGHMRERRLASLAEAREPRRVLDDNWDFVVASCLEEGLWNFCDRTVLLDADPNIAPAFGFTSAFAKPDDWVRTEVVSTSETLDPPLLQYVDEAGYWYANFSPLYVKFISNDPQYGMDLSRWPASFVDFVALRLAKVTAPRIVNNNETTALIEKREVRAMRNAKAKDALNQPPGFPPVSTWVRARRGFMWQIPQPGSGSGLP